MISSQNIILQVVLFFAVISFTLEMLIHLLFIILERYLVIPFQLHTNEYINLPIFDLNSIVLYSICVLKENNWHLTFWISWKNKGDTMRESLHLVMGGGVLTSKSVVEVRREWVDFLCCTFLSFFLVGLGGGGTVLQWTGAVVRCAGLDFLVL